MAEKNKSASEEILVINLDDTKTDKEATLTPTKKETALSPKKEETTLAPTKTEATLSPKKDVATPTATNEEDTPKSANVQNDANEKVNGACPNAGEASKEVSTPEITEVLKKKIVDQVHYYFGDYNLPRDRFLREEIKKDDGWIPMATLLTFNRLSQLCKDIDVILSALTSSNLIEVNQDKKEIRRSPFCPLPDFNDDLREETIKRTIYVKGFPKDGSINLDCLLGFFKPFSPIETVHMRHFYDKAKKRQGFKGSVLVVFPSVEKAKELYSIDDLKYKNMPLLIKWQAGHLEEKKAEIQERIARKEERNKKREEEKVQQEQSQEAFPRGVYVHISGVPSGSRREDIKEALSKLTEDVVFIDFSQGETEGYFRLLTANSHETFVKEFEGKLEVKGASVSLRVVEGDEESDQIKKAIEAKHRSIGAKKRKGGHGGRGGFHFKRKKV